MDLNFSILSGMANTGATAGFEDRDRFVSYLFNLAVNIKNKPSLMQRKKPVFISLVGQPNSGKELVALTFDLAFNPERYPNGEIGRKADANTLMSPENAGLVCFHGSETIVLKEKEEYEAHLMQLARQAPQSHIHIVSNLLRVEDTVPNYEESFDSDLLDMAITVKRDEDLNVLREQGLDAFLEQEKAAFNRTTIIDVKKGTPFATVIRSLRP